MTETATRPTTTEEQSVFRFLDRLRISGATNMFGAGSYITQSYSTINKQEARRLLSLWMEHFGEDDTWETIKAES